MPRALQLLRHVSKLIRSMFLILQQLPAAFRIFLAVPLGAAVFGSSADVPPSYMGTSVDFQHLFCLKCTMVP